MKTSLAIAFAGCSSITNPKMAPLTIQDERVQLSLFIITYDIQTNQRMPDTL